MDEGESFLKEAIDKRLSKTADEKAKSNAKSNLIAATKTVEEFRNRPIKWARLTLAMERESGSSESSEAAKQIVASNDPIDRAFQAIYLKGLSKADLAKTIALLPTTDSIGKAAKVHAYEKLGLPVPAVDAVAPKKNALPSVIFVLGMSGLGVFILVAFVFMASHGEIRPLGLKLGQISLLQADLLALRAAQLFVLFNVFGIVMFFVGRLTTDRLLLTLLTLLIIPVVAVASRFKIGGWRLNLDDLGVTYREFGRSLVFGGMAFLAQWPISLTLLLFGTTVLKFLPRAEHPLSTQLANDHSFSVILAGLISSAIIAPFFEEIVFRGLLFPALSRVFGSPIWGGIVSSVLFASLHPQGVAAWPALAAIGGFSCVLTYYTRSLVPSMVMHALHNSAVLTLALLAT